MDIESKIDGIFTKWQEGNCPGGQVLVRRDGRTVYSKCFGMADLENCVPVVPQTCFHIASVSKQFTVLAILLLQEEHKLDIDDDLHRYIGDIVNIRTPIAIRNLMNNTSGIRDQWELFMLHGVRIDDVITMDDALHLLASQKSLNFPPGTRYLYSNSNFTLLAEIVSRVSGFPFPEFVQKRIFSRLGMERSYLKADVGMVIDKCARSYVDRGDGTFAYKPLNFCLYGPTSVNSTVLDLSRLLDQWECESPTICSPRSREIMFTRPFLSDGSRSVYGAGLEFGCHHGMEYFGHGGVDAGFRAQMMCFPHERLDIVVLCNTTNVLPKYAAFKIADMVLGVPDENRDDVPRAGKATPGVYCGIDVEEPCQISVVEEDGTCFIPREGHSVPLALCSGGEYRLGSLDERFIFHGNGLSYRTAVKTFELQRMETVPARCVAGAPCGLYRDDETGVSLEIVEHGGKLAVSRFRWHDVFLYQEKEDVFHFDVFNDLPSRLRFIREDGCISGFLLDCGRARNGRFRKI